MVVESLEKADAKQSQIERQKVRGKKARVYMMHHTRAN